MRHRVNDLLTTLLHRWDRWKCGVCAYAPRDVSPGVCTYIPRPRAPGKCSRCATTQLAAFEPCSFRCATSRSVAGRSPVISALAGGPAGGLSGFPALVLRPGHVYPSRVMWTTVVQHEPETCVVHRGRHLKNRSTSCYAVSTSLVGHKCAGKGGKKYENCDSSL